MTGVRAMVLIAQIYLLTRQIKYDENFLMPIILLLGVLNAIVGQL